MAQLSKEVQKQVDQLVDEAYNAFLAKDYNISFPTLFKALEIIPEPKENYGESFNLVKYIIEDYLSLNDSNNAALWSSKIFPYAQARIDSGEREFLMGKVLFANGEYQAALENFKTAFKKSEGRSFEDEDPKYLDFLQNPEKYLTK